MKRIVVFFLAFMLIPAIALCSTTKVLDRDTALHPQGWSAGTLMFKGGTQVTLNENGEAVTGIMCNSESLITAGMAFAFQAGMIIEEKNLYHISFKGDPYPISFNEKGEVISGTLNHFYWIRLLGKTDPPVRFKNSAIAFYPDGSVKQGTLDDSYEIRPAGWRNFLPLDDNAGFIKFQAGTEVVFGPGAQVIKGTIANDLMVNGVRYSAGTTLQFSESAFPQKI